MNLKHSLLIWVTACLIAMPTVSHGEKLTKDSSPETGKATASQNVDSLISQLESIHWDPELEDGDELTYKTLLKKTLRKNLDIQIGTEKIQETQAKLDSVENKRVLFFFKYFNADNIEGSAESDVSASREHLRAISNQALLDASVYYFDLMRAVMSTYINHQAILQGLKQYQFNQHQFETGESTSYELMQTKTQLVNRYQKLLKASSVQFKASMRLAQFLGLENAQKPIYPEALEFENDQFQIETFQLFPEGVTEDQVIVWALKNRPDLKEMAYRQTSLENLLKANLSQFDKNHKIIMESSIQQMALKHQKLKRAVKASAVNALREYEFTKKSIDLAQQQLKLAAKALRQVQISHKAGFSSNKDVLDAQVSFAQAQVNEANALIDYNLSQVKLLHETGLISFESLMNSEEPIVFRSTDNNT